MQSKPIELVPINPPPVEQRVTRDLRFASEGEKKGRYHLPPALDSASPVGYRTRLSLTQDEAKQALSLLSLDRPTRFVPQATPVCEQELFEESSLGILTARQSTNYRGHRQTTLGPEDSAAILGKLQALHGLEAQPLEHAAYTHLVFSRPYRTPFTFLLTFIGHKPVQSLATVPIRALRKRFQHISDIPTIDYLQHMHLGILADHIERAAALVSHGKRRAQVLQAPFCGPHRRANAELIRALESLGGLNASDRSLGWHLAMVAQVGWAPEEEQLELDPEACRKISANMMALRSERIQPGVNQEEGAPEGYQKRQDMDVPDELTVQAGRAAYNAFAHWTQCDRERSKELLLLERIDVLTPNGKERLRSVRRELEEIADLIIPNIPKWADLPTGKLLTRNAARGKKAFALAGQRIYVGGLDKSQLESEGIDWQLAQRAFGAASARSALVAEIMGCVDLPDDCELLAGICLMAGPVNQNDIGKSYYGFRDILHQAFPQLDPTSLLVWTLKAKTIADPIGNEEQLLDASRKGALVDLRPGPHEVISIRRQGKLEPMRSRQGQINAERAFHDQNNFVTSSDGREIPGNRGAAWPSAWSQESVWEAP